jgi:hypothetical protein
MKANLKNLSSIWFLFALGLLLLNDFYLKSMYGNALTGKHSDFTGLFVFAIFLVSIFPKKAKISLSFYCIVFHILEVAYSRSFVSLWNSMDVFRIHRVEDYTDIYAIIVLPLAY